MYKEVTNFIAIFAQRNMIYAKNMRKFTLLLLLFMSTLAYSQNKSTYFRHCIKPDTEESIFHAYIDSLSYLRNEIYSLSKKSNANSNSSDSRYSRLFAPLNFYNDLAHRHFSLNPDDAETTQNQMLIDNALMNIYINHPELVKGKSATEKQAEAQKTTKKEKPVDVAISSYQAPKAEEMDLSPVKIMIKRPNFWTFSGEYYLQMMQNYYSKKWYQGGESNYSALTRFTLHANYNNKQKFKWENTLEMNLGFQTNKSDTVHGVKTSSDLIRYTGKVGLQATKKWYYTLQVVGSSQFMRSFASNSHTVNSDFMSPFDLNASLGMDYTIAWFKNKLTGSVHLAPLAMNYKYVDRLALATKNGLAEGKHSQIDYGSTFTLDCNWKFSNNVTWHTRLYGYTTYHRMELQWENTFNLKISKLLAASIYVYPRFDDSNVSRRDEDLGYFQLKEYTSLGLTYSF